MAVILAETIEDANQGSFRYVRFRFSFGNGEQVISGPHMLTLAQDADALRAALAAIKEQEMAEAEAQGVMNG